MRIASLVIAAALAAQPILFAAPAPPVPGDSAR